MLVFSLANMVLIGENAISSERDGRANLAKEDQLLGLLASRALATWAPAEFELEPGVLGRLSPDPAGSEWRLQATVFPPWRRGGGLPPGQVSAMVERGRDGFDLPLAAVVGTALHADTARPVDTLVVPAGDGTTTVALVEPLPQAPAGTEPRDLSEPWRLAPMTVEALEQGAVAAAPSVVVLSGAAGQSVTIPAGVRGDAQTPLVVVVTGGADLDARDLGDLDAVLVVDEGGAQLDGTRLRGAVICSGTVDLGATGTVTYVPSHLRWATDQSLRRVRLVPGTRQESWGSP